MTSKKRFNSYDIFYCRTRKKWHSTTGDRIGWFDCTCIHAEWSFWLFYWSVKQDQFNHKTQQAWSKSMHNQWALDIRLSDWLCGVTKMWVRIPSREKNKSNTNHLQDLSQNLIRWGEICGMEIWSIVSVYLVQPLR